MTRHEMQPTDENYSEWITAVNGALGDDRARAAFIDDAVRIVVAERDSFRDALIQCATEAGADVSGGVPGWPDAAEWAVEEVRELRATYDEDPGEGMVERVMDAIAKQFGACSDVTAHEVIAACLNRSDAQIRRIIDQNTEALDILEGNGD